MSKVRRGKRGEREGGKVDKRTTRTDKAKWRKWEGQEKINGQHFSRLALCMYKTTKMPQDAPRCPKMRQDGPKMASDGQDASIGIPWHPYRAISKQPPGLCRGQHSLGFQICGSACFPASATSHPNSPHTTSLKLRSPSICLPIHCCCRCRYHCCCHCRCCCLPAGRWRLTPAHLYLLAPPLAPSHLHPLRLSFTNQSMLLQAKTVLC